MIDQTGVGQESSGPPIAASAFFVARLHRLARVEGCEKDS